MSEIEKMRLAMVDRLFAVTKQRDELQGWHDAWKAGIEPTVAKMLDERDEMKQKLRELEIERGELAAASCKLAHTAKRTCGHIARLRECPGQFLDIHPELSGRAEAVIALLKHTEEGT